MKVIRLGVLVTASMASLIDGLVDGLVATVLMTAVMRVVGDGPPESFAPQGLVLHLVDGLMLGADGGAGLLG